jgi:hypothetical protein
MSFASAVASECMSEKIRSLMAARIARCKRPNLAFYSDATALTGPCAKMYAGEYK